MAKYVGCKDSKTTPHNCWWSMATILYPLLVVDGYNIIHAYLFMLTVLDWDLLYTFTELYCQHSIEVYCTHLQYTVVSNRLEPPLHVYRIMLSVHDWSYCIRFHDNVVSTRF